MLYCLCPFFFFFFFFPCVFLWFANKLIWCPRPPPVFRCIAGIIIVLIVLFIMLTHEMPWFVIILITVRADVTVGLSKKWWDVVFDTLSGWECVGVCWWNTRFSLLFEALNGRMGRLSLSENASLGGVCVWNTSLHECVCVRERESVCAYTYVRVCVREREGGVWERKNITLGEV